MNGNMRIAEVKDQEKKGQTHIFDGRTSSTFRSNSCHGGVVAEGVSAGDICFPLKPSNRVWSIHQEAYKIG